MNKFIDISEHNTIMSFERLFNASLKGVIIKATEGTTYIDYACDTFYDGITGNAPIGFYHYLKETSSPITQAQNFWNKIKDKSYEIKPILDVEEDKLGDRAEIFCKQFMQEFYSLSGQEMLLYSGRCYIEEHFSEDFKKDNLWWVADYQEEGDRGINPTISNCNIIAWQYTDNAKEFDFQMGGLDASILFDENNFYIKEIPFSDVSQIQEYDSIKSLQTELNNQEMTDKYWNELEVDGIAGSLTLSACPTLSTGAQGNITKWVQHNLGIVNDGIYGEETRQAVIEYQTSHFIKGDGIVGKKTWSKLLGMRG